jgi:hypothetical protein
MATAKSPLKSSKKLYNLPSTATFTRSLTKTEMATSPQMSSLVYEKKTYYSAKPSDFQILVKLGEVPMDLALYFNDMSSSASTEFAGVVNFLTILTNYCKFSTNLGLRAELIRQLRPPADILTTI